MSDVRYCACTTAGASSPPLRCDAHLWALTTTECGTGGTSGNVDRGAKVPEGRMAQRNRASSEVGLKCGVASANPSRVPGTSHAMCTAVPNRPKSQSFSEKCCHSLRWAIITSRSGRTRSDTRASGTSTHAPHAPARRSRSAMTWGYEGRGEVWAAVSVALAIRIMLCFVIL